MLHILPGEGSGVVCKLYAENFFSSLALFEYLTNRK